MEGNHDTSRSGEGPSSSSPSAGAGAITSSSDQPPPATAISQQQRQPLSRYESQKWRDWNTFLQYLRNHKPPLSLSRCSGAHVIEFLKYLDQFGKTKVHTAGCAYFGHRNPPASCACPLKQAWGSLDALVGRLRAAYEENGGHPESNPFGARAVGIYLREVRASQAKARGIPYEKKKRKRQPSAAAATTSGGSSAPGGVSGGVASSASAASNVEATSGTADPDAAGSKRTGDVGGANGSTAAAEGSDAPPNIQYSKQHMIL